MKELVIDKGITQSRAFIFEDNKLKDVYIENNNTKSISGNIYKGVVKNIVYGLSAAFVDIGLKKNALLHFDDLLASIKLIQNQEIIVQVIREGNSEKGPRVTTKLSLPGKYSVLLIGTNEINISNKLQIPEQKQTLKTIAEELIEANYGMLFRTEAANVDLETISHEYLLLKEKWENIKKASDYLKPPHVLYDNKDFYDYIIREYLTNDIDKIFLNPIKDIVYFNENPKFKIIENSTTKILTKIQKELDTLKETRFILPSGGFITLEKTEAFYVFDVNSGQNTNFSSKAATAYETNKEACSVIVDLINQHNLGGIILIDFIDMISADHNDGIYDHFKRLMKKNKNDFKLYGFTELGIFQLTRARKGKSLDQLLYKDKEKTEMSFCYLLKLIENDCLQLHIGTNKTNFNIYLNPVLYAQVIDYSINLSNEFLNYYNFTVNFIKSDFIENYSIELDNKNDRVKLQINDIKIYGKLLEFKECDNDAIAFKIKRF